MGDDDTLSTARRALRAAADAWAGSSDRPDPDGSIAVIALHDAARGLSVTRVDVVRAARVLARLAHAEPPRCALEALQQARVAVAKLHAML